GAPADLDALRASSRLVATAEFLSAAISEGLAGRRDLAVVAANDLTIGPAPGDSYAPAIGRDESGAPAPVYVDAGEPSSLCAALEVAKHCDQAATAHYDRSASTLGALATPGDVLAYRNLWNGYVVDTA